MNTIKINIFLCKKLCFSKVYMYFLKVTYLSLYITYTFIHTAYSCNVIPSWEHDGVTWEHGCYHPSQAYQYDQKKKTYFTWNLWHDFLSGAAGIISLWFGSAR